MNDNPHYEYLAGRRMELEHEGEAVWPLLVAIVGVPALLVLLVGLQIGKAVVS